MWTWAILCGIFVVAFGLIASKKTVSKNAEQIVRTKILTSTPHSTGRMNGSFYIETTFMLYYKDGSHKAVTVKNGTMEYDSYMSKLEG